MWGWGLIVSTGVLVIWAGSYLSNLYPASLTLVSDANVLGSPVDHWILARAGLRCGSALLADPLDHGLLVQSSCSFLNLRTKI